MWKHEIWAYKLSHLYGKSVNKDGLFVSLVLSFFLFVLLLVTTLSLRFKACGKYPGGDRKILILVYVIPRGKFYLLNE